MTNNKSDISKRLSRYAVKKKTQTILEYAFRYALLICLGLVIVKPLYTVIKEAITEQSMLSLQNSAWIAPATSKQSLIMAKLILNYWKALAFSIGNALLISVLQTLVAALAAYSFARLKFKGSDLLFGLVIFSIIVPSSSIMLAQYMTFRNFDIFGLFALFSKNHEHLNLIGSTVSLYVLAASGVGVKGGLYIYILRQSYRQLPVSIEEAAYVDGAGFLKTFFHIVIPSISSTLLTVSVLSFVWNYADKYFSSLLLGTKASKYQLALRLSDVQRNMRWAILDIQDKIPTQYLVNPESPYVHKGVASACAALTIMPLVILYFFVQRRFVQGVERSGLGGD